MIFISMKKKIILATIVFIITAACGIVYLNKVFLPTRIKSLIIRALEEQTHKKVGLQALEFNIFKGLVLKNLKLYDQENTFLDIQEISSNFLFFPIFKKQLIIPGITVKSAVIFVERRRDNTFNIADLFTPKQTPQKSQFNILIQRIRIVNSRIDFRDDTVDPKFSKSLDNLNLMLYLSLPASVKFNLKAEVKETPVIKIQATGEYKIPQQQLAAQINFSKFSPRVFTAYYNATGFSVKAGLVDASIGLAFNDGIIATDLSGKGTGLEITKDKINVVLNSDARANIKYNLKNNNFQYSGTADIVNSSLAGLEQIGAIEGINGRVKFDNAGLACDKISANILGLPLFAEVQLTGFNNPLLSINATSALDLSFVQGVLKDKLNFVIPAQLKGKCNLSLSLKASLPFRGLPQVNGSLDITQAEAKLDKLNYPLQEISGRIGFTQSAIRWQDLNFQYQDIMYKTTGALTNFASPWVQLSLISSDLSIDSAFNIKDKFITISSLQGTYGNSKFFIAGTVSTSTPEAVEVSLEGGSDINLKDLKSIFKNLSQKLDTVKPEGIVHAKFGIDGNLNDIKNCALGVALSSPDVSLYGLHATDFFLNYNQASGLAEIPLGHLSLYDGTLDLTGKLNLSSENLPYWINANMQNVKIEKLKFDAGAKDKDVAGTIQAEVKINGFSNDLAKINGLGKIAITNGKLWELNLFKGFGQLLFAQDFSRIIFKEGNADFIIQDKYIASDNLRLKSDLADLAGSCKIGFDGSLDAGIRIEVMDEMVPLTGTFKDVATAIIGRAGKFGSIKISGTLKEPKYKFKPAVMDILNSLKDAILDNIQKQ